MRIILGSQSPRRLELLKNIVEDFDVIPSCGDESLDDIYSPLQYKNILIQTPWEIPMQIAKKKGAEVFERNCDGLVIGADTGVFFNGQMLGKPKDRNDAITMLKMLSGKSHDVITGYAIFCGDVVKMGYEITHVIFNELDDSEIERYVDSGLTMDKAGGYGIQDEFNVVKGIEGDYHNVMGFPIENIRCALKEVME